MSEYEGLIQKLLEQKPDISRSELEERIKQKKEKIGAGYLTDQGALFLIASDLGVSLSEPPKLEMGLKDMYPGAKEVSFETRVLNLSPAKQFSRKDGSPFFLRTMTVYDNNSTASVKLWDEKANLPGIEDLKPGDLVKIIKAYVKSDLAGNPTINVGSGSSIETLENSSDIPSIESLIRDVSTLKVDERNLVVTGIIDGMINTLEFTNSRGRPGKALTLRLKGKDGDAKRVVLWGKDQSEIPKTILPGAKVKLFGVKTKEGNQGLEIHGNEATIVEIEGKKEVEPLVIRLLSLSKNNSGKTIGVGVDENKTMYNISDTSNTLESFQKGTVLECMPSKIFGNSVIIDDDSFVRKLDDEEKIPTMSQLRTKISDIKAGGEYCIEAIILKIPGRREVQTKNGELVALGEMFVEDDSGQIWLKGWRDQARLLDKFSIGQIVSVTGVTAKPGLEGRVELFLTPFSTIGKKS